MQGSPSRTKPLREFNGYTYGELPAVLQELVRLRARNGVTQKQLDVAMGVSQSVVSRLEMPPAGRAPSLTMVQRYAAAIGAEVRFALHKIAI